MSLLAQIPVEVAQPVWKEFLNYGVLGGIVIFIGVLIWIYAPKIVDAHTRFVESTAATNEKNAAVNSSIDDTLKVLCTQGSNSVKTNAALRHLAEAWQDLLVADDPQTRAAKAKIREAIEALRGAP